MELGRASKGLLLFGCLTPSTCKDDKIVIAYERRTCDLYVQALLEVYSAWTGPTCEKKSNHMIDSGIAHSSSALQSS